MKPNHFNLSSALPSNFKLRKCHLSQTSDSSNLGSNLGSSRSRDLPCLPLIFVLAFNRRARPKDPGQLEICLGLQEHFSAHGPPISPAARRSRDHQPPSGTEVLSGPGGPGGMGRRRRLGSRSPVPVPAMSASTRVSV